MPPECGLSVQPGDSADSTNQQVCQNCGDGNRFSQQLHRSQDWSERAVPRRKVSTSTRSSMLYRPPEGLTCRCVTLQRRSSAVPACEFIVPYLCCCLYRSSGACCGRCRFDYVYQVLNTQGPTTMIRRDDAVFLLPSKTGLWVEVT